MTEQEAVEAARRHFLRDDNYYGCAETTLLVLQEAFRLGNSADSSPAMALNGGVAWSGSVCGAMTGAALAVGRLAADRVPDHKEAKRIARGIVADLMAGFCQEFGCVDCRGLTGVDISTEEGHARFIADKLWHGGCMRQIEFVVHRLLPLQEEPPGSRGKEPLRPRRSLTDDFRYVLHDAGNASRVELPQRGID